MTFIGYTLRTDRQRAYMTFVCTNIFVSQILFRSCTPVVYKIPSLDFIQVTINRWIHILHAQILSKNIWHERCEVFFVAFVCHKCSSRRKIFAAVRCIWHFSAEQNKVCAYIRLIARTRNENYTRSRYLLRALTV